MSLHQDSAEFVRMIRESAGGIADRTDLGRIRALRFTDPGFDRPTWEAMCELGWPALRIPESRGGIGAGLLEYCALAEELGGALVPEPLIGSALCAQVLTDDPVAELLAGSRIVLPAWQEAAGTTHVGQATVIEGRRVHGTKQFVGMAAGADAFLVFTPGGCALVDARADGLRVDTFSTQDGGSSGTLSLDGVVIESLWKTNECAFAEATLATAAYLLGVIEAALTRTIDYLRTRVQFGRPIGSFQALQHRAVDLTLQASLTRASVGDAAALWHRDPGTASARAAICRAKARASEAAMLVTRQAVQLHGGIGYTDEHDIGLYLRKAMTIAPAYGGAREQRARYAELLPEQDL